MVLSSKEDMEIILSDREPAVKKKAKIIISLVTLLSVSRRFNLGVETGKHATSPFSTKSAHLVAFLSRIARFIQFFSTPGRTAELLRTFFIHKET